MSKDDIDSPWMTAREAAAFVRLSVKTLRNRRSAGLPPKSHKSGARVVYHRDVLRKFIENSNQINHRG